MHVFIFWCLAGSILDLFWMAEGTRVNEEVLDASAIDRPILGKTLGIKSLKDERGLLVQEPSHRRRRNLGVGSLNTTTTPPKLERYTTVSANLPTGSSPPLPFNITCYEGYSCKGRCRLERDNGTTKDEVHSCYCDPYCNSFKDCCADFDQFCKGVPSKQLDDKWGCHNGKRMIDSCPTNYTLIDAIIKCETPGELSSSNYADVTPVISTTGKMYRNQHCALCNGVKNQNMQSLSYNFESCQLTPPESYSVKQKFAFLFDYCDVVKLTTVGEQRVRECTSIRDVAGYCSVGESEKNACQQGSHRIVYSYTSAANYKNVHCARCQGESDHSLTCGPLAYNQGLGSLHGKPFTAILDIGSADNTPKSINTEASCGDAQVYDPFLETCRKAIQFPSQKYSPKLNKYNIAMWIKASRNNTRTIHSYPTVEIFKSLAKLFGLKPQVFELVERENVYASPPMAVLVVNLYIEKNTTKRARRDSSYEISIDMLLSFTRPFDFSIAVDNFTVIKATSRLLTCVRVQHFTPEEYVIVPGSSSIYINQTGELLSEKQYFANSTKIQNGHRLPVDLIAVCRGHLPTTFTCNGTYISLDKDEYVVLSNNSIYRNASNTVYNQGEYSIINGSVVVCTEYSNKYTKTRPTNESQNDTALRILTNIGLSLSVVCLVFVLVTYTLFGELRTLPGINLMNLSSALLVAHLLWLIGSGKTGSHGACVAIAILLHYSFLASFVWMSIIAYNTWKIFSSMRGAGTASDKEYRRKKICQSLAIGWLPVLALVLICLALDQSGAVEIKYAGPKGCWINNGLANLFVFILPLAGSVIWNAVFFGLAVKAIYKAKKQARMVTEQRENQRNFSIYIKIAVLMGFTWIFGFLALLKSTYFGYPFVFFNTIQGVYIAFAFTFNSRTIKLYRSKFISPNNTSRAARSTNKYKRHSTTSTHV